MRRSPDWERRPQFEACRWCSGLVLRVGRSDVMVLGLRARPSP